MKSFHYLLTVLSFLSSLVAHAATTISPGAKEVGEGVVLYQIAVTSDTTWTASVDTAWVSVTPITGSATGFITVTVSANTASSDRLRCSYQLALHYRECPHQTYQALSEIIDGTGY
jgi:hypothetical protein